jgi:cytochrome b561
MAEAAGPRGYSRTQLILHWTVAALVLVQFFLGDHMEDAWKELRRGREANDDEVLMAWLHVATGLTIFVLALWRIVLVLRRGAPPLPEKEHWALRFVAHGTHIALYALLIGMPLAGATAWFLGIEDAGDLHEDGATVLALLVLLHAAGGMAQHFVMRTDVLRRILVPERR